MIGARKIVEKAAADIIGRSHNASDLGDGNAPCKPDVSIWQSEKYLRNAEAAFRRSITA